MNPDEKAAAQAATRLLDARQLAIEDVRRQINLNYTKVPGADEAMAKALWVFATTTVGYGFDAGVKAVSLS